MTLVELLVVVAIVGILTSLVLGTVRNATKTAQETQCAANLRKIHFAFQGYVADNQGYIPPVLGPNTEIYSGYDWNAYWWGTPYLGGYLTADPPERSSRVLSAEAAKILNCPARPLEHDAYWKSRHSNPPVSYLMAVGTPYNIAAIENLSKTLFITEGRQSSVWKSVAKTLPEDWIDGRLDTNKKLRRFHNNSMNLLFFDGHIEKFSGRDEELQEFFAY